MTAVDVLRAGLRRVRVSGCSVRAVSIIVLAALSVISLGGCASSRYAPYDDYDARYEDDDYREGRSQRAERRSYRSGRATRSTYSARSQSNAKRTASSRTTYRPPSKAQSSATADATMRQAEVLEQRPVAEPSRTLPQRASSPPTQTIARAKAEAAPASQLPKAAAAATAAPTESEVAAARRQIDEGYRLLKAGFVKKARERFDGATVGAEAAATLGLARSLDPTYLRDVAFPDVTPNPEEARKLYRRAILLGASDAKNDLARLDTAQAAAPAAGQPPPVR